MSRLSLVASALLVLTASAVTADPVGLAAHRLGQLARLRTGTAHLASSADPSGGNDDRGHYLRVDGREAVLMEAQGPGQITRIWSANPTGRLRITLDGAERPTVECDFADVARVTGETPRVAGFVSEAGGGVSCWYPLPFARSAKVSVEGADQLYYQVNYTTFAAGTAVNTFVPGAPPAAPTADAARAGASRTVRVPAGGQAALFEVPGPDTITRLALTVTPCHWPVLRQLRLQLAWDGQEPSVDVPLLDLFASGFGAAGFTSAPLSVRGWDTGQLDFPLPFARGARAVLVNRGDAAVTIATALTLSGQRPDAAGYFHATWHSATTVAGEPHTVLDVSGQGHYVGTSVALHGDDGLAYLEGDETITVDGEERLQGTGTEDYFDSAWYFRRGPFANPCAGAPLLLCGKAALSAYRWHLADCIPFRRRLQVTLEHGGHNDAPGGRYRSVAYWYASEPQAVPAAETPPEPPACTDKRSRGAQMVSLASLLDRLQASGATATLRNDRTASLRTADGRYVAVDLAAGGALELPLTVPTTGLFEVVLKLVAGGVGEQTATQVDGETLVATAALPPTGAAQVTLGRARLTKGQHTVRLTAGVPVHCGVDTIELREVAAVAGAIEAEELPSRVRGQGATARVQPWTELPADAVRAASVVGGGVPTEAVFSGGAQLLFTPSRPGDELTVWFTVPEDGDYGLAAAFTEGPEQGRYTVRVDGDPIPVQRGAEAPTRVEVGHRVPLGTHRLRSKRPHRLTLRAEAAGRPIGLDYLLVQPAKRGHEAELMPVDEARSPATVKERFGAEPRWSGGAYLRFAGGDRFQRAGLCFWVPRSGRYRLTLKEAKVPGGQVCRVYLAGRLCGTIDCSAPGEALGRGLAFEAPLRRGRHRLTVQTDAERTAEGATTLALDVLDAEYLGPSLRTLPWASVGLGLVALLLVVRRCRRRR